ncbi:hypothetical protein TUBRATIS_24550 [Tubulinosema ratisbonensis]|uniref:Uncharacterized protein n=1 Tax=Tubulinosema ratisbonensis TaxID=291195 RepID=A0A437AJ68_9MICR|nr:hypothetical protein TUBRATIS_24550 [Tubulinosema ratisbonensis]
MIMLNFNQIIFLLINCIKVTSNVRELSGSQNNINIAINGFRSTLIPNINIFNGLEFSEAFIGINFDHLIKVFENIKNFLIKQFRYSNYRSIVLPNYTINTINSLEVSLKDYFFDFENIFSYLDIKNEFSYYFIDNVEYEDIVKEKLKEHLFDFVFYNEVKETPNLLITFGLEKSIKLLTNSFISVFSSHSINGGKINEHKSINYMGFIFIKSIKHLKYHLLMSIFKFIWLCLLKDEGYKIIFILFPELICLIKYALDMNDLAMSKKVHILLGLVIFRVQGNLQKIRSEICSLYLKSDYVIHHSKFINFFVSKTRLYGALLLFVGSLPTTVRAYFVFLALLSYIRVYCPDIYLILPFDENICSNISTSESIEFYCSEFFKAKISLDKHNKKITIDKFIFLEAFLTPYKENDPSFVCNIVIDDLFDKKREKIKFENLKEFKDLLERETFFLLLNFIDKNKESMCHI